MADDLICCMILQRSWAGRCHPMAGFTTGTRRPGITNPLFTSQDTQLLCWGPALPRHSWTLHSQSLGAAPLFARILVKNPDYCYLQQHVNANYFWTVALRSQTMLMPTLLAMLFTLEAYNPTRSTSACCRRLRKVDVAFPPQAARQDPYTMRYGARQQVPFITALLCTSATACNARSGLAPAYSNNGRAFANNPIRLEW